MQDSQTGLTFAADVLAVLALAGLLATILAALLLLRAAQRREAAMLRERAALTAAYAQVAAARTAAECRASLAATMVAGLPDGMVMFDAGMRLVLWNDRFGEIAGVPPELLREGTTLDEMIRAQALAGEFGRGDMEAEVMRRSSAARRAGELAFSERQRPNGRVIELRRRTLPGGEMVTLVADVTARRRMAQPMRSDPAGIAPAAAALPPGGLVSVPPRPPRRATVLLVEDILVNQLVTATQLRRDGHRVDVASTGAEAVRMVASTPYDLVLMDLMMPGMSGHEAARAIRGMAGLSGVVPILALTANTSPLDRQRCIEAGMQGMLSKPVSAEELSAAIADLRRPGSIVPVSTSTSVQLLDIERLTELREGLPAGLFVSLAEQCIVDMRERMMDLHEAIEMAETERTVAASHALAGMAGSYGMAAVERRMRHIMAAGQAADAELCRRLTYGMDGELDRSEEALQTLVQAQPA